MKKFSLFLLLGLVSFNVSGQWSGTNPLFTNFNVGIGHQPTPFLTLVPLSLPQGQLHISRMQPSSFTVGGLMPAP